MDGKALGKGFAKQKSGSIVWIVSKILKPFYNEKKDKKESSILYK